MRRTIQEAQKVDIDEATKIQTTYPHATGRLVKLTLFLVQRRQGGYSADIQRDSRSGMGTPVSILRLHYFLVRGRWEAEKGDGRTIV